MDGDEKIQKAYGGYISTLYAAAKGILDRLSAGDWDGACRAAQHIDGKFSGLRGYEDEWKKARVTALRDQQSPAGRASGRGVPLHRGTVPGRPAGTAAHGGKALCHGEGAGSPVCRAQTAAECPGLLRPGTSGHPAAHQPQPEGGGAAHRLAEELSRQFRQVFVDEYQDTNAVQDRIFRAVSDNGRNLFMVGDVKQSIYRFRQADPAIFLEKKEQFSPGRPKKSAGGTDRCSA